MVSQCVGSILSSLVLRSRKKISMSLSTTVMVFAIPPSLVMIIDGATGGSWGGVENGGTSGKWNPGVLFPLYMVCGVCYGVIEIGKRVIPRMLVGGEMAKLRQIDSVVSLYLSQPRKEVLLF